MNLKKISLTTLMPEFPAIYEYNNNIIENYLDVIYNEETGVVIVPVNTSGRIKGATGEFVTTITDNLIVKSQYTNLYDNITTADYSWYTAYIGADTVLRDPSTWENAYFKYIDVNKPYYKVNNNDPILNGNIALKSETVSQIVELIFNGTSPTNPFIILLDPNSGLTYDIAAVDSSYQWLSLICIGYNASIGSTWTPYHYGRDSSVSGGGGGGGSYVLPIATISTLGGVRRGSDISINAFGTISVVPRTFLREASIGSGFTWVAGIINVDTYTTDSSLDTLRLRHNATEASLGSLTRVVFDASLVTITTRLNTTDSSLDTLRLRHNVTEVSLGSLTRTVFDASISTLTTRLNTTDSSLSSLTRVMFDASISILTTRLNTTDSSLDTLRLRHNATEASLGSLTRVVFDASLVTITTRLNTTDSSLDTLRLRHNVTEVSLGSLTRTVFDASISTLTTRLNTTDSSLNTLRLRYNATEASLGSLTRVVFDASTVTIWNKFVNVDTSLLNLGTKNANQDTSLNSIWTKLDACLGSGTGDVTKAYVDGSLARYVKNASMGTDSFAIIGGYWEVSTGITNRITAIEASLNNSTTLAAALTPDTSTSLQIRFDKIQGYVYGTRLVPLTGNFTMSASDAIVGCTNLIISASTNTVTFPTTFKKIGGTYVTNAITADSSRNWIYVQYVDASTQLYNIAKIV